LHAGDRAQQLNGPVERGDALLDRFGEPLDLLVEEVQVREVGTSSGSGSATR
jgi:hypothetical protein